MYASTGATGNELKPGEETWGDFFSAENTASRPLAPREKFSFVAGEDGAEDEEGEDDGGFDLARCVSSILHCPAFYPFCLSGPQLT